MKLLEIIGKVGSGVIRNVIPGGGLIIDTINDVLPSEKNLLQDATGEDIQKVLEKISPEHRAYIIDKEFDVQIAEHDTLKTMLASEATSVHTTRPYIAKGAFHILAFAILMVVSVFAYAVVVGNVEMVSTLTSGWAFLGSVLAPIVTLLWAYFGVLRNEAKDKLSAATGNPLNTGIVGTLTSLIRK